MPISFPDTVFNLNSLPWQLTEIYFKPVGSLFGGKTYKVVSSYNDNGIVVTPTRLKLPTFLKALILSSYVTSIIFPTLTALFVSLAPMSLGTMPLPLVIATSLIPATTILATLTLKALYRFFNVISVRYPISNPNLYSLPGQGGKFNPRNSIYSNSNNSSSFNNVLHKSNPVMQSTINHENQLKIEAAQSEPSKSKPSDIISNYEEILELVGDNEAFTCFIALENFTLNNIPVFVVEDKILISKSVAEKWEHKTGMINKNATDFTYFDNPGHINQLRYDRIAEEIFWVDPESGEKIKSPYFCPTNGLTYELDLDNPNPRDLKALLPPGTSKLYPNVTIYKAMKKDIPQIYLERNKNGVFEPKKW